jgi:expansin (peptidoglycan-binding protein)
MRHPALCVALLAVSAWLSACGGGGSQEAASASTGSSSGSSSGSVTDAGTGSSATSAGALSPTYTGQATYYGATGAGACSFDPSPGNLMVAAMNATDYAGSAACGEYVVVQGPKGSVTVRITDLCPECPKGNIDLSAEAFALIADPVQGRVPITWYVVPGNISGPVSYRYKEGSSRWWTGLQVRNHRLPITRLEILPTGASGWIDVQRLDYNYFVHPTAIAPGPLQVRITALGGTTLVDTLPEPQPGVVTQGSGQF